MIDLHVHTWRCRHAVGTVEEYVRAAARAGIATIAFTEHLPLAAELASRIPDAGEYAMPDAEFAAYVSEVHVGRALGEKLGVEVLLGAEADLDRLSLASGAPGRDLGGFDVVLGSVHFIDDWAFDDPSKTARYAEWRLGDLWERYFDDVIAAARTGMADVMAHADLVKKFTKCPDGGAAHLYRDAAAAFASAGVAVEVSSAGLRKPCRELYPGIAFLRELARMRVPVTIGSDAHTPEEVGMGLDAAVEALAAAGYRSAVVFRSRVAEEVALDAL